MYREEGVGRLLRKGLVFVARRARPRTVYNRLLRPRLPRTETTTSYNGVTVRPYRFGDGIVPWSAPPNQGGHRNEAAYERALVAALREEVVPGDRVVVVGGGLGVTAVVAARRAGPTGQVVVYEGAVDYAAITRETVSLNDVDDRVEVRHAIVDHAERLEGRSGGADTVAPGALPDCDVLQLDCEGAEEAILPSLDVTSRSIIVETHGNVDEVRGALAVQGYEVVSESVAEAEPYAEMCRRADILVFVARRSGVSEP